MGLGRAYDYQSWGKVQDAFGTEDLGPRMKNPRIVRTPAYIVGSYNLATFLHSVTLGGKEPPVVTQGTQSPGVCEARSRRVSHRIRFCVALDGQTVSMIGNQFGDGFVHLDPEKPVLPPQCPQRNPEHAPNTATWARSRRCV